MSKATTRQMTKDTENLYLLMWRLGYDMRQVCQRCDVPPRTPSRWKVKGLEPRPAVFNRVLGAMVDMGIKDGKLLERARGKSVAEVLEMGVL